MDVSNENTFLVASNQFEKQLNSSFNLPPTSPPVDRSTDRDTNSTFNQDTTTTSVPSVFPQSLAYGGPTLRRSMDHHNSLPRQVAPQPPCNASSPYVMLDGHPQPVEAVVALVGHLRRELIVRNEQIAWFESELRRMRRLLGERERDVDQLKSVLDQKYEAPTVASTQALDTVNEEDTPMDTEEGFGLTTGTKQPQAACTRVKKQGVSGESGSRIKSTGFVHYEKDERSRRLIREAILSNDFLKQLEPSQVKEIVNCMYDKHIERGCYIIREGEPGDALYVSAEGKLEVTKGDRVLGRMEVGRAFGEMALLYNCNRTASVRALTNAKFWTLDRQVYQQIMMISSLHKHKENLNFLQSVPVFKKLSQHKLHKLADVLEQLCYEQDDYIIRQGEVGETFFIIQSGEVQITQFQDPDQPAKEIRVLGTGDWFGERALYTLEKRSANAVALSTQVNVLCLDRSNFIHLIGDLNEIKSKEYADYKRESQSSSSTVDLETERSSTTSNRSCDDDTPGVVNRKPLTAPNTVTTSKGRQSILQEDLTPVAILGIGGFGRVELVVWKRDQTKSFALKCMKKQHIVETRQQEHIFSERNLMFEIQSPFVCKLFATYRDSKFVYMLLEACLGGELWTILRNRGNFDDNITRFVVASVLEAFTYLHTHHIIYRDLKPENLLLDEQGYIKLCDFGFAKKIPPGRKTWTFCGTPEYVAPEIILNKGHDHSADYWSLGILMFELLTGSPPFTGIDPMKIYNIILRGIDAVLFPPFHISRTAAALIHRLCAQNPVERLGYGRGGIVDIKQHKYFQGFDWIGLCRRTLAAPIIPKIAGPTDVSNFDKYPDQFDVPADENSGWDIDF
nr:unnamed protein product [Spirometra erinaceieuropaei]